MTNEIYERQKELDLNPPKTVTIIGVGGVGSWVALDMALAGVEKVIVADHDKIERHNLNRTPFTEAQVGKPKTQAVTELITERRMDAEVIPLSKRIEDTGGGFREDINNSVIIDCRDHASPLPDDMMSNVLLTAGYDGLQYTLHFKPDYENIWGEGNTEYDTVPSFVAPPQFLASIITVLACRDDFEDLEPDTVVSDGMVGMIKWALSSEEGGQDE